MRNMASAWSLGDQYQERSDELAQHRRHVIHDTHQIAGPPGCFVRETSQSCSAGLRAGLSPQLHGAQCDTVWLALRRWRWNQRWTQRDPRSEIAPPRVGYWVVSLQECLAEVYCSTMATKKVRKMTTPQTADEKVRLKELPSDGPDVWW